MLERLVLSAMIVLLAIGGFVAGVAVFIDLHSRHSTGLAVIAGVGAALSSWTWAALLGLAMEIADSLRKLVWSAGGDPDE